MGWSPPSLLHFLSPPALVRVFPPFVRPCHPFLLPVPVYPLCVTCVVCRLSRWVWGVTLAQCPRHRQDMQMRLALRQLHRAVLHVDAAPHYQQASTDEQSDHAGAVL